MLVVALAISLEVLSNAASFGALYILSGALWGLTIICILAIPLPSLRQEIVQVLKFFLYVKN